MKNNPYKGEWCEVVKKDLENVNIHMNDDQIAAMPVNRYKSLIKRKVRVAVFAQLIDIKDFQGSKMDLSKEERRLVTLTRILYQNKS